MSERMARVGELLKREIGSCIERNFEFREALVTVHAVDVAPNLRSANVFVGIIGEEQQKEKVLEELNKRRGMIQTQVFKRVTLKYSPQLTFLEDNSVERGVRLVNILDEIEVPEDLDENPG